ncbi:MAG: endonuclease/exonuclease/phosphatase family protein [Elainellaceae cyanobacterium]
MFPVLDISVGELLVGDVPVEEPAVVEMPFGDMPVGEVPGEDPPVGEMPVGEIPGEEVPGEEVPRNSALLSRAGEFQIGGFSPDEGLDTPGRANDEIAVAAAIFEIQGAERTSPLEGQLVITTGIVTAIAEDGFYFQDAIGDGDDATSDGLFVFTGILPNLLIGDEVNVVGTVSEFTPGGPDSGNLSTTQLINPDVVRLSGGNPLPTAVIIGEGGRIPPTELIDNAPPAEEPGMETPGMEIPGMEPGMEDPGVEAPGMEIPGMEPGVEVPGMETPGMETPDMEIPGMEPGMEDPGAETPGMETPGMDPGAEAPGMETPGMEPGMEIPGMEEPEIEPITGIDFFESLEGMRVTVVAPQVVGATNRFGEIYTFAAGTEPTGLSDRGTLNISPTDFNPERIQIDPDSITSPVTAPLVDVGATLSDVTGVVGYSFGNYEVIPTEVFTVVEDIPVEEMPPMEEVPGAEMPGAEMPGEIPGAEMPGEIPGEMPSEMPGEMPGEMPEPPAIEPVVEEVSLLTPTADQITIASYNVLNLDPVVENVANVAGQDPDEVDDDVANGRFTAIANDIITNLNTPDIIGLQEIQDSDGAEITDISSADLTYQTLIDEIAAAGGPTYQFIDTPGLVPASVDEAGNVLRPTGGQPGGNIRVGYLYNPDRVSLVEGSVVPLTDPVDQAVNPDNPFFGSRIPLAATFLFNGQEVTVVNNHFSSKSGSAPLFGTIQPAVELQSDPAAGVNGGLDERIAQAEAVQAFVGSLLAADPDANVVALGDFNEFEFLPPLEILEQDLFNLTNTLAENERYSFIFQGNSQAIDHILVSNSLADQAEFDAVHINAEFAETPQRASDHDPLLARLTIAPPVGLPPVVEPPVVEPPVVEPPIAEPPVVGPPTTELPIVEPPIVEPPIVEAPVMEPPAPELPPAAPPEIAIPTPGIAPPVLPPVISPLLGLSDSSGGLLGDISPAAEPSLI